MRILLPVDDFCWVQSRKQSSRMRTAQLKSFIVRTKATPERRNGGESTSKAPQES